MNGNGGFEKFLGSTLGRVVVTVVSALIIWGLFVICADSDSTAAAVVIFLICAVFGWRALNKITPDTFLFLSITGWIVYFVIKGILAFIIGFFIAPFRIGKMISDAVANSLNDQ